MGRDTHYHKEKNHDDIFTVPIPLKGTEDSCMNRIPYASLIAALMCFTGVVLFTIMMSWGFNATAEQTRRTLRIEDWPWLDKVQIFFIVLTVLMALFSLFFLIVGFTATGATRENMYRDPRSRCGGRFMCAVAIIFTAALLISWLFIISIVSMLCIAYEVFSDDCNTLTSYSDSDCLDFGIFEPLIRKFSRADLRLCGGDVQQFCALTATARTWYIVGWVGSAIVLLGLAMFLAVHTANFIHVGHASRYIELRELLSEPVPSPPSVPPPTHHDYGGYVNDTHPRARDRNQSQSYPPRDIERFTITGRGSSIASSRMAEQMSDSVSQYQYDRKYYNQGGLLR